MEQPLRTRLEPEDVLQNAYLGVFRRIDRFADRGSGSFLNWILTIVDHELIDVRRALYSRKRDIARETCRQADRTTRSYWGLLDRLGTDSATPSKIVRREEAVEALLASLSSLSQGQRRVIELRFLEGCSVAVAARLLGQPQDTIVTLTRTALQALREAMDRLGEFTRGS